MPYYRQRIVESNARLPAKNFYIVVGITKGGEAWDIDNETTIEKIKSVLERYNSFLASEVGKQSNWEEFRIMQVTMTEITPETLEKKYLKFTNVLNNSIMIVDKLEGKIVYRNDCHESIVGAKVLINQKNFDGYGWDFCEEMDKTTADKIIEIYNLTIDKKHQL